MKELRSDSLTWKLKMVPWKTPFLYKQGFSHFHVSESECNYSFWPVSALVLHSPHLRLNSYNFDLLQFASVQASSSLQLTVDWSAPRRTTSRFALWSGAHAIFGRRWRATLCWQCRPPEGNKVILQGFKWYEAPGPSWMFKKCSNAQISTDSLEYYPTQMTDNDTVSKSVAMSMNQTPWQRAPDRYSLISKVTSRLNNHQPSGRDFECIQALLNHWKFNAPGDFRSTNN